MSNQGSHAEYELPFGAFIKLCRATWSLTSRVAASLPGDVSFPQFVILEALSTLGPMNQVTLAQKILRTSASVNVVVDNLEQRGLVQRRRSAEDRRCAPVDLTDEGRQLMTRILPVFMTEVMRQFAVVTPEQQKELGHLCRTLGAGPDAAAEEEAPSGAARSH